MKKNLSNHALLFLRLVVGLGFMNHGWAKLMNGPTRFERLLALLGVPFPQINSWIVPLTELFGGLAIFVGAFVSIATIPLIGMMLVAIFSVHLRYGFSSIKTIGLSAQGPIFGPPGYEVALLYVASLIALILAGAGPLSIDHLISARRSFRRGCDQVRFGSVGSRDRESKSSAKYKAWQELVNHWQEK